MASAVLPIPPIPCRACTTTAERVSSCTAMCSAVSSSSRPVNTGLRAGTFHTRLTGSSSDRACGSSRHAADRALEMSCSSTGAASVVEPGATETAAATVRVEVGGCQSRAGS